MIKIALAASLLLAAGISGANAAMLPKVGPAIDASGVVEVQHRSRGHKKGPPQRWIPGRRYDRSPPGWRRHGRRPHDWRRRGCVTVGPVWFCP